METQSSAGAAVVGAEQPLMKKNEKKKMIKVVMVGIDESDESFYALRWTLDHLFVSISEATETRLDDEVGKVVLVHVQQPFHHYVFPAGPGGAGLLISSHLFIYCF